MPGVKAVFWPLLEPDGGGSRQELFEDAGGGDMGFAGLDT